MKTILFVIAITLMPFLGISQGQIMSITVDPVNPTTNDLVTVYVDLMFNSGDCALDHKGNSTTGNTTTAYAMHCTGMLTVMCHVTDTFDLGYLLAGSHTFNFTLSSGSGGPGCSPGIVPDDTDNLIFTVTSALGMEDPTNNSNVSLYPNPINNLAIIKINGNIANENLRLEILDAVGKIVMIKENISSNEILIERNQLKSGIYFYRLTQNENLIATEKFIVD